MPTGPYPSLIDSPHYTVLPRVGASVDSAAGGIDLTPQLVGFTLTYSIDNACGQGSFTFARGKGSDSLSPLIAASNYQQGGRPLLDPNGTMVLNLDIGDGTGVMQPMDSVFLGRMDRVIAGQGGGLVTVQCRDYGGFYLNTTINQTEMYGSVAGEDLEVVMGQILAAHGWSSGDIYVPVSPGYAVFEFPQEPMSVLAALRILAQQIGWDVRHFPGDERFLRLYDPARERVAPDAIIGPTRYEDITELTWGDEDVRNLWHGYWEDAEGTVNETPVIAFDQASIDRYDERFAQIYVRRAEGIRSTGAMQNFLNAALADNKEPFASHQIRMPFYPTVLLNDLHLYQANGEEYDTDQLVAVVGYTHQWQAAAPGRPGVTTTTISARGRPMAAYREYRHSVPPKVLVSTTDVPPALWAPEGTLHLKVDSLSAPLAMMGARRRAMSVRRPTIIPAPNPNIIVAGRPLAKEPNP